MKLWSKGLGTKTVTMSLKEARVENTGTEMLVKGKMGAPVYWDYTITMSEQDLIDILDIAARKDTVGFMLDCKSRRKVYSSAVTKATRIAFGTVTGFFARMGRRRKAPVVAPKAEETPPSEENKA